MGVIDASAGRCLCPRYPQYIQLQKGARPEGSLGLGIYFVRAERDLSIRVPVKEELQSYSGLSLRKEVRHGEWVRYLLLKRDDLSRDAQPPPESYQCLGE